MYKLALALSLLSSAVAAEYTTTLLLVGFNSQAIVGSVMGNDATATTYSLTCPAAVRSADCDIPPSFILAQGPSTMHYSFPANARGNPAETVGCDITSDHGVCSGSVIMTGPSVSDDTTYPEYGPRTRSYSNYGKGVIAQVVTITAGAAPGATGSGSSIASTSATVTVTATATASAQTGQTVGSSGSSSATGSGSGAGGSSGSTSSKVSTGGVPMITGRAQWAIGGAAAAVAIAAM